jgi:hypothetical protein
MGHEQPGFLAWYLWVQGMVLICQTRREEAEKVLSEGLEQARSMPDPYSQARILVQLGVLRKKRGEPDAARERLREALVIFQRLGAKKVVEQTEQVIAALD